MKKYSFLIESKMFTTIDHTTGKEISVTPEQYNALASKYPDKYCSIKQQDKNISMLKQLYLNKDPRWFKFLNHMKSTGATEEQIFKMIGI